MERRVEETLGSPTHPHRLNSEDEPEGDKQEPHKRRIKRRVGHPPLTEAEIHNVVNSYYLTFRHVIINVLKCEDVENWNKTVPTDTIDHLTGLITKSFKRKHLTDEDVRKICNIYYAAYAKAIKQIEGQPPLIKNPSVADMTIPEGV